MKLKRVRTLAGHAQRPPPGRVLRGPHRVRGVLPRSARRGDRLVAALDPDAARPCGRRAAGSTRGGGRRGALSTEGRSDLKAGLEWTQGTGRARTRASYSKIRNSSGRRRIQRFREAMSVTRATQGVQRSPSARRAHGPSAQQLPGWQHSSSSSRESAWLLAIILRLAASLPLELRSPGPGLPGALLGRAGSAGSGRAPAARRSARRGEGAARPVREARRRSRSGGW